MEIKKFKIEPEHVGQYALIRETKKFKIIASDIGSYAFVLCDVNDIDNFSLQARYDCEIKKVIDKKSRSYDQLKLYWQACRFVAFNSDDINWNESKKVDEQIKIKCRHVDCFIYYDNKKTGSKELHIKTKSISFKNLGHTEACGYFEIAFEYMADYLNMKKDEFVEAVMSSVGERMTMKDRTADKIKNEFSGQDVTEDGKLFNEFSEVPKW